MDGLMKPSPLEHSAARYAAAAAAHTAARDRLAAAVREAVAAGMSEVQAAKVAGVSRMTVRSWLGKDRAVEPIIRARGGEGTDWDEMSLAERRDRES